MVNAFGPGHPSQSGRNLMRRPRAALKSLTATWGDAMRRVITTLTGALLMLVGSASAAHECTRRAIGRPGDARGTRPRPRRIQDRRHSPNGVAFPEAMANELLREAATATRPCLRELLVDEASESGLVTSPMEEDHRCPSSTSCRGQRSSRARRHTPPGRGPRWLRPDGHRRRCRSSGSTSHRDRRCAGCPDVHFT